MLEKLKLLHTCNSKYTRNNTMLSFHELFATLAHILTAESVYTATASALPLYCDVEIADQIE